ncbi:unnamed protein product [Owenia fusiformis]|uniref:Replication protein A OB domain-containing protein n=1 Tax=Owenia fusiformis TaxID=6347 RepID=A0A8S4PP13_OWEFU|nr:unnamed protein product [Owenia fusiformis]
MLSIIARCERNMAWTTGFSDFGNDWQEDVIAPKIQSHKHPRTHQQNNGGPSTSNAPSSGGKAAISDLSPGVGNTRIVGVILAKEEAKSFTSKKNPGTERFLLNFSIRDSPAQFINATCWGGKEHIHDLAAMFHIGDIVEVINAQIQTKRGDNMDDKFRPWTPSPYVLNISEQHSTVKLYGDWDLSEYNTLLHIPIKPHNDFYTLLDVVTNGQNLNGELINLLVAIKSIGAVKEIVTKSGRHTKRCEIKLFDDTNTTLALVLWDEENINLTVQWTPKDTVLFIADVRVNYDDFRKGMLASANSKTIFTINPDTQEAHSLYQFAQTAEFSEETSGNYESTTIDLDANWLTKSQLDAEPTCLNAGEVTAKYHNMLKLQTL